MNRPNFFIIGAPKCGTTSLASWLSEHPRVFISPIKEPHFFSTDFNRGNLLSIEAYEALFNYSKEGVLAVGEASTEYLYSKNAVAEIENVYPGSRYIAMIRNPVDLAFSLYNYEKEAGREVVANFEDAWRKSPDRRQGEWVSKWCLDPKWLDYQQVASLGQQLERLFNRVERNRVLVLVLDDVKIDPRQEYLKVLAFLGLGDDGRMHFQPENRARQRRWPALTKAIQTAGVASKKMKNAIGAPIFKGTGLLGYIDRLNSTRVSAPMLDARLRAEMLDYFSTDIESLSVLIGRDFSGWLGCNQTLERGNEQ